MIKMTNKDVDISEENNNLKQMKNYYNKALNIVKRVIGREEVDSLMYDKDVMLDISYDNEDWAGVCIDRDFYYEIKLRYDVLYHCEPKKIIEILIHEIIYTFCDTYEHDGMWFYYADMISSATQYNIPVGDWFDEE